MSLSGAFTNVTDGAEACPEGKVKAKVKVEVERRRKS
jgi:hypothetical protein